MTWLAIAPHASMYYADREGRIQPARVVMPPSESFIYFGCPRCTSPL